MQCMAFFFQIQASLSLKNARLLQVFVLDTKSTCLVLLSRFLLNQAKNVPVQFNLR